MFFLGTRSRWIIKCLASSDEDGPKISQHAAVVRWCTNLIHFRGLVVFLFVRFQAPKKVHIKLKRLFWGECRRLFLRAAFFLVCAGQQPCFVPGFWGGLPSSIPPLGSVETFQEFRTFSARDGPQPYWFRNDCSLPPLDPHHGPAEGRHSPALGWYVGTLQLHSSPRHLGSMAHGMGPWGGGPVRWSRTDRIGIPSGMRDYSH